MNFKSAALLQYICAGMNYLGINQVIETFGNLPDKQQLRPFFKISLSIHILLAIMSMVLAGSRGHTWSIHYVLEY